MNTRSDVPRSPISARDIRFVNIFIRSSRQYPGDYFGRKGAMSKNVKLWICLAVIAAGFYLAPPAAPSMDSLHFEKSDRSAGGK